MTAATTGTGPPSAVHVEGHEITLPVEVRSARMVAVQYLVSAQAAQRLVAPTGLEVVRLPGGRAVCALSAVDYADSDLGPYHEVAVAFVVRPHDATDGWRPSATGVTTYIHRLPVNQAYTCLVGRNVWGFPKWMTSISYTELGGHTRSVLVDGGEFVLALDARRGSIPLPDQRTAMSCYSLDDTGVLRRTPWTTHNRRVRIRAGGTTLELGRHHLVAEELSSLGLPHRALATLTTGSMGASFGPPEIVTI